MTTVASPVSIRDQALAIIAGRLTIEPAHKLPLAEIGGAVLADILLDLERRFDIGIDVDEVLPNGTVGVLLELVAIRAAGDAAGPRIFHWDDERTRRGLPYFGGRPRLASGSDRPFGLSVERPANMVPVTPCNPAPPPWPDLLAEPRTPCAPVAVPSDEAWAAALDAYGREERFRARLLTLACICLPFAIGAGAVWLRSLGGQ